MLLQNFDKEINRAFPYSGWIRLFSSEVPFGTRNHMKFICFALFVAVLPSLAQTWVDVPVDNQRIHVLGRTTPAGVQWNGGMCQALIWSGTSVSMSFEGTSVKAILRKSANTSGTDSSWYKIFVDGKHIKDIAFKDYNSAADILLAEGLSAGVHSVTLYKRTEAMFGSQAFCGFSYNGSNAVPELKVPARKLEFIGNSITCGYGVLDDCKVNTTTWGLDNCPAFSTTGEDHFATYAAQTAQSLEAQNQSLCWSGRGVYRNNTGFGSGPTMPLQWKFAAPLQQYADSNTAATWDFKRYVPNAVIIGLGTNDFAPGVPPEADFVKAYVDFVKDIKTKYGAGTPVVLLHGPMMSDTYPAGQQAATTLSNYLDKVIAQTSPESVFKLVLTPTKSLEFGVGSDWHPNVKQNELNASELVTKLRSILAWNEPGDSVPSTLIERKTLLKTRIRYWQGLVQIQVPQEGIYHLSIVDISGKTLYSQELSLSSTVQQVALPQWSRQSGIHFLRIQGMGFQATTKFVIP